MSPPVALILVNWLGKIGYYVYVYMGVKQHQILLIINIQCK